MSNEWNSVAWGHLRLALSCSIMHLRFIYVAVYINSSFLLLKSILLYRISYLMGMWVISVGGIVNKATINFHVQVFIWPYAFISPWKTGIPGSMENSYIEEIIQLPSKMAKMLQISISRRPVFQLLHILSRTWYCPVFF